MGKSFLERQVENTVKEMFNEKGVRLMRIVQRLAAKQGGENAIENYRLLGKRALIVAGVAIIAVEATMSVVGLVISRKSEEQRMEKIARRVYEEEAQKEEA